MKVILSRPRNVWPDWLSCVMYQNTGEIYIKFWHFPNTCNQISLITWNKNQGLLSLLCLLNWNVFVILLFSTSFIILIWNRISPWYTCNGLCKWNFSFSINLHEKIVLWKCVIWYLSVWMLHHL